MSPAGAEHGSAAAPILISLGAHIKQHRLGRVYTADAGFRIGQNPDTARVGFLVRGPDKRVLWLPVIGERVKWETRLEDVLQCVDVACEAGTSFGPTELRRREVREIPHPTI